MHVGGAHVKLLITIYRVTRYLTSMINNSALQIPVCAVLGPWAGGTTVVAQVLYTLGLQMGEQFFVCNDPRTGVTYEETGLRELLMTYFDEPLLNPRAPVDARLNDWAARQRFQANIKGRAAVAAKHPILSMLVPELVKAWGPVKFIRVLRPADAVLRSLERRRWWPTQATQHMQEKINSQLDADLVDVECHCIDYDRLCKAPENEIRAMLQGIGLNFNEQYISAAARCVRTSAGN